MALHKIKEKLWKIHRSGPSTTDEQERREEVVYRYRKQRGVNLGSWFVQERWICESTFLHAAPPAQSDLDIARGSNSKAILESHWDSWIQEHDWKWLAERGFNAVRIPIGYYHICGADTSVLDDTEFKGLEHVFEGAWVRITQAIETANRYGIGVLIDLHAAPGKQNPDSHSGTSNPPTFFTYRRNRTHTTQILCSLLTHITKFTSSHDPPLYNMIGIELLNEPRPASSGSIDLMQWYTTTIKSLRPINDQMIPIYIGDCWRLDEYADYIARASSGSSPSRGGLVVLDHHLYRCFTQSDIRTSATEHGDNVKRDMGSAFLRVSEKLGRVNAGLVVGEWSAALNPGSLRGVEREEVKRWVDAQLEVYENNTCCAGWFFWTYKKQCRGDMGWSLVDALDAGVFPSSTGLKTKQMPKEVGKNQNQKRRENSKQEKLTAAFHNHTTYWSRFPGRYNHQLFETGFSDGWDEAYWFFETDLGHWQVPELGFVHARAFSKTRDHGENYWEYEHGFIQGAGAARKDFEEEGRGN